MSSPPGAAQDEVRWAAGRLLGGNREKRAGRRAKRGNSKFFDTEDYVWTYPPSYQGPRLSAELDQR